MIKDGAFGWWLMGTPPFRDASGALSCGPEYDNCQAAPMSGYGLYSSVELVGWTYDPAVAAAWVKTRLPDERMIMAPGRS